MRHFLDREKCINNAEVDSRGLIWCSVCRRRIGFRVTLTGDTYSVWVEPKFVKYQEEINKKFAHKTGLSSLEEEMGKIIESVKELSTVDNECAFYDEEPIDERGVLQ